MDITTRKFLDYLEKEKNYSSYTIGNYRRYLRRFNGFVKIKPQEISRQIISEFREKLRNDGLCTKTVNFHLIAIRSLLQYLMREGVEAPHYRIIEVSKEPQRKIEYMTVEEVFKIMNTIHIASETDLRDKALIELLFATGLRVGEVVSLNRKDIDLDSDHFSIIGKGRRIRIVFISARARYWLSRYLKRRTDDAEPMFINYRGPQGKDASGEEKRLTAVSVQNIVRREARRAGLTK
jgi:site-specific recombinase XerD